MMLTLQFVIDTVVVVVARVVARVVQFIHSIHIHRTATSTSTSTSTSSSHLMLMLMLMLTLHTAAKTLPLLLLLLPMPPKIIDHIATIIACTHHGAVTVSSGKSASALVHRTDAVITSSSATAKDPGQRKVASSVMR